VPVDPATAVATPRDAAGEVSRGRSSRGLTARSIETLPLRAETAGDRKAGSRRRRTESLTQVTPETDSMRTERQQGGWYQRRLFGADGEPLRPAQGGADGIPPARREEPQTLTASDRTRTLTDDLMERICDRDNLNRAYRKVKANKGAPGVDGMTVDELAAWIAAHKDELIASLLDGSYEPQPVRGVQIPKPGGGVRQLGIPTVVDRLVQQAILQVLEPLFDPTFSNSSYGFRPGKSAHQALAAAQKYVTEGRTIVVDMDLEKFFDRVNHDILLARLARRLNDKRLLRIIRRFLEAGLLQDGVCLSRHEGTPQGGPLSPLLANLLLDDLDRELERRGHKFCRYADDCNIYVQTKAAGARVLASLTKFLETKLRLRVNRDKSAAAHISERKFLGHRLLPGGKLGIAPQSLDRAQQKVRALTRRNRGVSLARVGSELNSFLTGGVTYYRHAQCRSHLQRLDEWLRHRLRCVQLKQRKRAKPIADFLRSCGVPEPLAWRLALSGKGWWRLASSPPAQHAMSTAWFERLGLVTLTTRYAELQPS
jgi:RNA-directed DNA polymerase